MEREWKDFLIGIKSELGKLEEEWGYIIRNESNIGFKRNRGSSVIN